MTPGGDLTSLRRLSCGRTSLPLPLLKERVCRSLGAETAGLRLHCSSASAVLRELCEYTLRLCRTSNGRLGPRARLLRLPRRADKQRCEQAVRRRAHLLRCPHARLSLLLKRKCVGSVATDSRPCSPLGQETRACIQEWRSRPPAGESALPPASLEVSLARLT